MISRDKLLSRIRRMLGDTEMRTFSDYEIADAIDDGLAWLSRHLALTGSDLTEATAALQDGDKLPSDFVTLRSVYSSDGRELIPLRIGMPLADGGYRIENDTFRAQETCTVSYQRTLPLLGDTDSLDLPEALTDTVARSAVLALGNADDQTRTRSLAADSHILMRRQRSRRTAAMPWRIR